MGKRKRPRKKKAFKILAEAIDIYSYMLNMKAGEGVGIHKGKLCACTFHPKHIPPRIGQNLNWRMI